MSWLAVVPLKQGESQKSRLAESLDSAQRAALTDALLTAVLDALHGASAVRRILLLSPSDPGRPGTEWVRDEGRGLNPELKILRDRFLEQKILIVHADLPFLESADVTAMLRAAGQAGVAIAPDKFNVGTNAMALDVGAAPQFCFGVESFPKHKAAAPQAAIVQSRGLSLDIDTPADLQAAVAMGFRFPRGAAESAI